MKLFQRMTALALAGAMSLCMLTGCGKQGEDSVSVSGSASGSGASSAPVEPLPTVDMSTITNICSYLSGLSADETVATVDGVSITAGELMYWLVFNCDNMSSYYYYHQGTSELPWNTIDESTGDSFADYLLQDAVRFAAMQRIVEKKAKEAGLAVRQEDKTAIQTSLETLEQQLAADTALINVEQYLWQQALTADLYRWNCEMDYLYQGLSDHYFGEGGEREPTEDIVLSYLDTAGYYKVKHILLATVDTDTREALDEKTVAAKKKQAEDLLDQLKASGNDEALFDQLMNQHSEDPGLAANPQGYDFQVNTSVDPAFEAAALELEPGQISDVVEGVSGYHIILRLPMDAQGHWQTFIDDQMSLLASGWLEIADVEMTGAGEKLDAKAIYEAMTAYRNTIAKIVGEVE